MILTLMFLGGCASVSDEQRGPTLYLVGDSTMAEQPEEKHPEWGWGQALPPLLEEGIALENHARNGRSTKSFVDEGRWATVRDRLQPGDFVVIGFGHNDQKSEDPNRYAEAQTDYRDYLNRFIDEATERGAEVILVTSIVRRRFDDEGQPVATLGDYPDAVRAVAAERAVALVDLNAFTRQLLVEAGPEMSRHIYMHAHPGQYDNLPPEGKQDDTHLQVRGAEVVAKLFVAEVQNQDLPLARWLKQLY
ncbi:rhamnogalacturonan acetylesterase [Marinimicrobium alkaliphilum]|uniref:rhamnogalacturonan acetylesterase n=1 Tax=Marinimicrobium alkaliphilum TaxID=2202654 RepID=UPI001300260F|nr:rhamnogalacturonan acetylesterase [Marinimicrobium alkaliphilum]